ncbi:MAG: twin-arginine translocase TatA/TatE family subunit [Thermales bacterium]|nr:twin-arginine translocase TatA/TatE family subunit [Thermales bacterium]
MPRIGLGELIVIAALAILFFGKDKLPDLAKSIGKSVTEFNKAIKGESTPTKKTIKKNH